MLKQLAREIVSNWETPNLAKSVTAMSEHLSRADRERAAFADQIAKARLQTNDELEIDDEPLVSVADGEGVWVNAWIWIKTRESE